MSRWFAIFIAVFYFVLIEGASAQVPELTETVPAESFLGEQFCFTTEVSNTGNPGFGPYLRLVLPPFLQFDSVSAFGGGTESLVGTFPTPDPELTDPLIDEPVSGVSGYSYYNIALPVGSIVDGGPPLPVELCLTIDEAAEIGVPLPVDLTPVYQFGNTATGANGPIVGATVEQQVVPTVLLFNKTSNATEGERATGPAWPISYSLTVDIANTATVSPITITDTLPSGLQYLGGTIAVAGGQDCAVSNTPPTATPGGDLTVECTGNTIGTTGDSEIVVTYDAYIVDVLDQAICQAGSIDNEATVSATYIDQSDADSDLPSVSDNHSVRAEHVAIQKAASPAQVTPGDTVDYSLSIQVSDYADVAALSVTDQLPDGIDLDGTSVSVSVNGVPVTVTPDITPNSDGTTTLELDIAAAYFAEQSVSQIDGGTAITISYAGDVREAYNDESELLASDVIANAVTMNYDLAAGASDCDETSNADVVVEPVAISKTLVNPQPFYEPGDTVIYRLRLDIPSGDTSNIQFVDFLPLPALQAGEVNLTYSADSADCPGSAGLCRGPDDTLNFSPDSVSAELATNAITIDWPDVVQTTADQVIEVDLHVPVTNEPFADGLFLTNILQVSTENSQPETAIDIAPIQIQVGAPELELTKGIESSSNANSSLDPDPVGDPVDSNLLDADAGDAVSFVITLDNVGSAAAFDIVVLDVPPTGLETCGNVTVTGTGTNSGDLFATNDPLIIETIPAGGRALVRYECDIAQSVTPREQVVNIASANWKAADDVDESFPDITDDAAITIAEPTVDKTAVAVNPGPMGSDVVPGDVISYQLTVTLPEGTTPGVTIEDALPAGFSYVPGSASINDAGFTGSISNNPPTVGGSAQTPLFSFGDITATGSSGTADNSFLLSYDVLVLDNGANAALNSPQNKTNTATLNFSGNPDGGISDSHTVQFREPELALSKSISPSTALQGGDTVTVTLTLQNTGTADALDITVNDALDGAVYDTATVTNLSTPAGFTNTASGATNSWDSTAALPVGASRVFSFDVDLRADVLTGSTFTNTANAVGFSQLSGVSARRETTDIGSDDLSTTAVTATKTLINDSEPSTGDPAQSVIGEVVRFQLAFTIPTGTTLDGSGVDNAIIRDILPFGLAYQTGSATIQSTAASDAVLSGSVYGNIATAETSIDPTISGNELRFNLGDITNTGDGSEQIVIRFDALVENISGNDLGVVRTNRARLRYQDGDGTNSNIDNTQTLRILEPQFSTFTKTATPATGQAGTTIDFEVVMQAANAADTATAFDVVMNDQLPADMSLDVSSVSAVFAPAACSAVSADNSDGPTRVVELEFSSIPQGCEVTISYQADLLVSVAPGDTLTNQADLRWTSVPGSNGTAAATPGVPGAADGERTGSGGDNDYVDTTSADVDVEPGTLSKAVVDTSSTFTGDAEERASIDDLAIGETATFHITATIPFGTTSSVIINDTLPYTNGVMAVESVDVVSVGPNLSVENDVENDPSFTTISDLQLTDGIDDSVAFNFGQIVNDPNTFDEGVDPQSDIQIVVEVVGLVVDQAANTSGDALTNTALVQFGPGLDASASAEVDVVEPVLALDKTGDITSGQGGDVVTFTVTLDHAAASNADAHDVVLVDNLPIGMQLVPGSLSQTSGAAATTLTELTNGIQAEWTVLGQAEVAVLTFQAELTIDAVAGETVTNTSTVDWTSMPGTPAEERSASTNDTHGVMITEPGVTKVVASTDNADTLSDQFGAGLADLSIGEEVTYTLTVELPKGTSRSVQVVDTLPSGTVAMEVVSSELTTVGANIAGVSAGVVGTPNAGNTEVSWNLGDLTNDPNGAAGPGDLLTFEVVAVVMDDSLNQSGVVNQVNTVTLTTDSTGPASATAAIDVVAPTLEVLKAVTSPADGFVEGDELVDYELTVRHTTTSTAPAYRLALTDTLPADIGWEGDGTVATTCPGFSFDSSADPVISFSIDALALDAGPGGDGECTITFQGRTAIDVQPNRDLENAVSMDYESLPNDDNGQSRTRNSADTASVTVNAPGLVKEVVSTSFADTGMGEHAPALMDLTVGEEVTYQITVTLPEGVTNDALVVDSLPVDASNNTQLEAIGASVVSVGSGGSITTSLPGTPTFNDVSGDGLDDTVSFDFGQVTNTPDGVTNAGDRLVLQVQARLVDTPSNVDAAVLINQSDFTFDGGATQATASVEVVEPQLAISKSMALVGDGRASITLQVSNGGTAPAFDLDVTDVLDTTVWDLGSLSIDSVSSGFELVEEAGPGANETTLRLRSIGSASIPAGNAISGQVTLALAVLPPATNPLPNTADLNSACTLAGACTGGPGREQDPDDDSDTLEVPDLVVEKVDALLVDADSSSDVSPGDTLRYTLTLENTGAATASNLLLTDTPDVNTSLVVGSVTTTQGTVLEGNGAGESIVRVDVGSLADAASATITFDVTIVNPAPAGLEQVSNQALLTSDQLPPVVSDDPDPSADDDPTVTPVNAAPDLQIIKDDGDITAVPGGLIAYTLDYTNVGNQDATGVVISETVPDDTIFNAAGSDPAWSCVPDASAGSSCSFSVDDLDVGDNGSVSFAVIVDNPLPNGVDSVFNATSITDDGSNGVDPTPGDNSDNEATPINATPALGITKSLLSANPNPVAVGSKLRYSIVVSNTGNMDLTGVTISDPLVDPIAPASCRWDSVAGVLAIGESVSCEVEYTITVADVNNGQVVNTATANSDQTGPESDQENVPIANTPAIALQKTVSGGAPYAEVGDVISYQLVATNIGNARLVDVVITDAGATIDRCSPAQPAELELTESLVCEASYSVTQADIDNANYVNAASVSGQDQNGTPVGDTDSVTVGGPNAGPALDIVKQADKEGPVLVGDTIDYTITATNIGNVTLAGVVVEDNLVEIVCNPATPLNLAPAERTVCTGSYVVTDADVAAGEPVINSAVARGTDPAGDPVEDDDTVSTPVLDPVPAIALVKEADPQDSNGSGFLEVGEVVEYTLTATNVGNILLQDVMIEDDLIELTCTPVQPLALEPGEQLVCRGDYELQPSDIQTDLINTAAVTGTTVAGDVVEDEDRTRTPTSPPMPVPVSGSAWMVLLVLLMMLAAAHGLHRRRRGA